MTHNTGRGDGQHQIIPHQNVCEVQNADDFTNLNWIQFNTTVWRQLYINRFTVVDRERKKNTVNHKTENNQML